MTPITFAVPSTVCGIYHLMRGDEVRYVGQTANVFQRIGSWRSPQFVADAFDRVAFYPCDRSELDSLEEQHIRQFQPALNSEGIRKPYQSRPWIRAATRCASCRHEMAAMNGG